MSNTFEPKLTVALEWTVFDKDGYDLRSFYVYDHGSHIDIHHNDGDNTVTLLWPEEEGRLPGHRLKRRLKRWYKSKYPEEAGSGVL